MVNNQNYALAINTLNVFVLIIFVLSLIYHIRNVKKHEKQTVLHNVHNFFMSMSILGIIANGNALYRSIDIYYSGNYTCKISENLNLAHFQDRFAMFALFSMFWYVGLYIPCVIKTLQKEIQDLRITIENLKRLNNF